ncbi:MAG: hypothetical protein FWF29_05155 [Treponema sp.]|nr:hypothetical protein [Treponema sp.]
MRKLLAVCTFLIMGASFAFSAGIALGGRFMGIAQALGNTETGVGDTRKEPWTQWTDDMRLTFWLTNDSNTAGAGVRLTGNVWNNPAIGVNYFQAWWQPTPMFYFCLGKFNEMRKYNPEPLKLSWSIINTDAYDMKAIQFAPWDAYQGVGPINDNIYTDLKAQGDKIGMQFSFIPMDNLHFTLVWNGFDYNSEFNGANASLKNALWDRMGANVSYTNDAGGEASVFFTNKLYNYSSPDYANTPDATARMKAENRRLSFMYTQQILNPLYAEATLMLPFADNGSMPFMGMGLGFGYKVNSDFNINARAAAEISFLDEHETFDMAGKLISGHNTKIGFDLVPTWLLNWSLKLYVPIGYAWDLDAKLQGWSICPYIMKDAGWVSFWVGFRIWNDNTLTFQKPNGDPSVSWAVPVGLMLSF